MWRSSGPTGYLISNIAHETGEALACLLSLFSTVFSSPLTFLCAFDGFCCHLAWCCRLFVTSLLLVPSSSSKKENSLMSLTITLCYSGLPYHSSLSSLEVSHHFAKSYVHSSVSRNFEAIFPAPAEDYPFFLSKSFPFPSLGKFILLLVKMCVVRLMPVHLHCPLPSRIWRSIL